MQSIQVPSALLLNKEFQLLNKSMQDAVALYCFVLLKAGCVSLKERQVQKWRPVGYELLSMHIRRGMVRRARLWLITHGFVECDGRFSFRVHSRRRSLGHRFTYRICGGDFVNYALQSKRAVKRLMRANSESYLRVPKPRRLKGAPSETHLRLYELLPRFTLGEDEMRRLVGDAELKKQPLCLERGLAFVRKQFWGTADVTGRLYTSLTSLWKPHRSLLHGNGEPLCEIDISACQPLCLSLLLEDQINAAECMRFRQLAESRRLYDEMALFTGLPVSEAKEKLLAFLCGHNPSAGSKRMVEKSKGMSDLSHLTAKQCAHLWFSQTFPDLTAFLFDWKSAESSRRKMQSIKWESNPAKSQPHCIAAFEMQRLEAEMVIDGICAEFLNRYPGELIASVHDAVLVVSRLEAETIRIVAETVTAKGLNPQLKVTRAGGHEQRIQLVPPYQELRFSNNPPLALC